MPSDCAKAAKYTFDVARAMGWIGLTTRKVKSTCWFGCGNQIKAVNTYSVCSN